MVKKKKPKISPLERWSLKITYWVGTPYSLIVHSIAFAAIFALRLFGFSMDSILLILTTAVSLEAIYMAILIQMSVNRNTLSLQAVEEDIDDIQEDVEDIAEDVEDIQEDVEELEEEVEDITEDLEHIQQDDVKSTR
jgi:low affinity Fe/Cu permease